VTLTLLTVLLSGLATEAAASPRVAAVAERLPPEVAGLRVDGPDQHFDNRTIFDYIDGAAEVYRAYGLRACLARRYGGPGGPVTVDLFEMGSAADAFGVFTHDQDGETVAIGGGALLRSGWLSFWKGPYFVSLTGEAEGDRGRQALLELAGVVAGAIAEQGDLPDLVRALPAPGRVARSLRYLHDAVLLATHLTVPDSNPLALSARTEVALARYAGTSGTGTLLIARYPTAREAAKAVTNATRSWLAGCGENRPHKRADGTWADLARNGELLVVVLGCPSRADAVTLLDAGTATATRLKGGDDAPHHP
jgi:hypothetical protein